MKSIIKLFLNQIKIREQSKQRKKVQKYRQGENYRQQAKITNKDKEIGKKAKKRQKTQDGEKVKITVTENDKSTNRHRWIRQRITYTN